MFFKSVCFHRFRIELWRSVKRGSDCVHTTIASYITQRNINNC